MSPTQIRPKSDAPVAQSSDAELAAFAQALRATAPGAGRPRLIFALDATMSRQPTWDAACTLQARLFEAAAGALQVQLVYFRGVDETRASRWLTDPAALTRVMTGLRCQGGATQLRKVLLHAERQASAAPVAALVHVGDCLEEPIDALCAQAAALRLLGVKCFMFQEGADANAARGFAEIARITGGAHVPFAAGAAETLGRLLGAIGAWAAGGEAALRLRGDAQSRALLAKLT